MTQELVRLGTAAARWSCLERGYLRGEVERQDQIGRLVGQARSVDGVTGVGNLLRPR